MEVLILKLLITYEKLLNKDLNQELLALLKELLALCEELLIKNSL